MNTNELQETAAEQESSQVVTCEVDSCPDLPKRLAKIYQIAILRYNQSKSTDMANDATAENSNAVLTHSAGSSGNGLIADSTTNQAVL